MLHSQNFSCRQNIVRKREITAVVVLRSGSCNASQQQKFPSVIYKALPPSPGWSRLLGSALLIKQNLAMLIRWEVLQKTKAWEEF